MLVGRFFKVDENSQYSDGTVGFRYLNIFLEKEESGIPKYPIYMTLDSHSINFYFNGYLKTPTDDKDKYIHTEILHLPLSKNLAVKDNLTSVLVNAYDHELLGADKYKNETRRMGYSSLERFKGKEDNICRYLILDFLFDLEHSRVFENSPFYEEVEIRLKENLFFSAIAAVSAYDYNKKMFLYTQDNFPPERKIAAQNFLKAEREWLNCLILDDAEIIISLKKKWFKGIEEELKSIKVSKEKEKKKDGWKERINFFKKKIKEEKENIKKKLKEEKQKFKDKRNEFFGEEVLEKISKIFIRRYHLYGGFNTVILNLPKFFKVMLRIFITFHLLLMLLLIFVSKINIDLLPKLNIFGLLLLLDLIFFFVCLISLLTKRIF